MALTILTALDANNVMACNGKLAYKVPSDLAFFKNYTQGKTVLVGRNTYEEVASLPDRDWIRLERATALNTMRYCVNWETEVIVGGGAPIYQLALGLAQKVIINRLQCLKSFPEGSSLIYFPEGLELMYRLVSIVRFRGFDQEIYKLIN